MTIFLRFDMKWDGRAAIGKLGGSFLAGLVQGGSFS
jgi:hypothetical protein